MSTEADTPETAPEPDPSPTHVLRRRTDRKTFYVAVIGDQEAALDEASQIAAQTGTTVEVFKVVAHVKAPAPVVEMLNT